MIVAVVLVVAGFAVRLGGTRSKSPGSAKAASYLIMAFGLIVAALNTITMVNVGQVGVEHFLGSVKPVALPQGVHVVNPFATITKMSVREQSFPENSGVERIEAQTSEQLNVMLEVAILFRLDGERAPELFQRLGTEEQIKRSIVLNAVRNGVRDATATKSINEIFSPNRRELATDMREAIQAKAGDRIEVLDVFVRDIQAPQLVRTAIEEKLQREQQVAAERFQTEIIQEQARQEAEEAKGMAEAQRIISEGLTPAYLTFYYIQQLSSLGEGNVVYVPTEGGIPLIRNLGR